MTENWHKSSYSGEQGGDCVEVAEGPQAVKVRDTQHRELGALSFPSSESNVLLSTTR
ncbi:DUF397 domain-containing protein [Nocardiopsis sp. SBT366]|uniref:DUF397 domain-containing protein n=1 Tax=Nocardiopsis sp. SBT366 TaxID=1580529 RepID=UPI0009E3FE52|nr:DUF397 domain-containing protein [Nocardiopsis sp. SBT366]